MILKNSCIYRIELSAVFITGLLKFVFMDWLQWRAFYIGGICLLWFGYIYFRLSGNKDVLKHWGFKKKNFRPALVILMPLVLLSVLFSILYGHFNHSLTFTWQIIPVLLLYPAWGILQQYLMLGIIANDLMDIFKGRISRYLIVFMVSALFALIHYPGLMLMAFTFFMEAVFMSVYFKWRNLWAIGIAHGWIATFLLYYVLERDLWIELFGRF